VRLRGGVGAGALGQAQFPELFQAIDAVCQRKGRRGPLLLDSHSFKVRGRLGSGASNGGLKKTAAGLSARAKVPAKRISVMTVTSPMQVSRD